MRNKILIILTLLSLTAPAQAQGWFIGGTAFLNRSFSDNTTSLTVRPDVGYSFGKVSAGVILITEFFWGTDMATSNTLGLSPYAQYYFWSAGAVSLFVEGGLGISHYDGQDVKYTRVSPYVSPGMEISLTDHWSVVGYLGKLEYDSHYKNLSLSSDTGSFSVGLYYSF